MFSATHTHTFPNIHIYNVLCFPPHPRSPPPLLYTTVYNNIQHKIHTTTGDELLLKHGTWQATGYVIRLHEASEEVALELRADKAGRAAPTEITHGYSVECVWNGTTFERMQRALKQLAVDGKATAQILYHKCVFVWAGGGMCCVL